MNCLFTRQAQTALNWALAIVPTVDFLNFICQTVPGTTLLEILREDNFYILERFIMNESGVEKYKQINEEALKSRLDKFKLLLTRDRVGVKIHAF